MNEFFAAEPHCVENAAELRLMLNQFGPYAGRYLAAYPSSWFKEMEAVIGEWSQLEQAKAKTALRRAMESSSVLVNPALGWDGSLSWFENVCNLVTSSPKKLDGAIVCAERATLKLSFATPLEDLRLPPTSDERIATDPEEFARVCRTLLLISPEIVLVDPYLDLSSKYISDVVESLLSVAARGKANKLKIWARTKAVVNRGKGVTVAAIRDALDRIMAVAPLSKGFSVSLVLVDDSASRDKMHGRYLMSLKGGIRVDQGFQRLPRGRRVDVGPIGVNTHQELLTLFLEEKHDLKVEHRISKQKS